jgi:cytochrome c
MMRSYFRLAIALLALAFVLPSCTTNDIPPRILIFSKTEGFRHDCIPTATAALRKLCLSHGIAVDTTEDAEDFNAKNLRRYNAVIFLCTTGDVLTPAQETDFERYIQAGGGYVGIHSATDTEYGWTWYGGLVGGYFNGHPAQQNATLRIENHEHLATKHLPGNTWTRFDEWYNFKNLNPNVKLLLSLDEHSYEGGTNGEHHPASWYQAYDGGRAFYTALGHTKESYSEDNFMQHVLGGIRYAIGTKKRLDYTACRTPELPDPTRFTKTVLASELTEPMELDMFPDGKIIFIERRGNIKVFNPATGLVSIACKLPVYSKEEDGLMGLAIDPDYAKNNWIYLYYSSPTDESANILSRFVFRGDSLDRASEVVILKVAVQRQECCHTGGCIEIDAAGNMYLSTGDNTNPFESEGYSPSDERPGRSPWDAQKSSANTNDLRGKILRIKVHQDGSYTCPAGNLFAAQDVEIINHQQPDIRPGQPIGRPEIYVMGCRNPFRLSFDDRRKLLYWGEVGPDAGEPDTIHGPQGHDEVNRARAAGFFGWPYFVGDNKPYRDFNFAAGKPGAYYDPNHPINDSPNNTGARELPPAQPAFIWYPYGNSTEFPLTGNGGRNAMAGPTYYCDKYPAETRLPDYYDGKLITYDWMRGWMMAVTVDTFGNFSRMEPFAENLQFSRPMDMIVDKNGTIWLLEYGTQWFATNPDARLTRLDYVRGNRPPVPSLEMKKSAGAAPFAACFSAAKTKDYDGERLRYEWNYGDGTPPQIMQAKLPTALGGTMNRQPSPKKNELDSIVHVFYTPGTYEVILKVTDNEGATRTTKQMVHVGNEPPEVRWDLAGKNRSFYQPNQALHYQLIVRDEEDGALENGTIPNATVAATIDYLETGFDITSIAQGHQAAMQQTEYARGKMLLDRSDCKTCHAEDRVVNGPAYQSIADRYRNNEFAVRNLSTKILKGGAGVWGQTVMSAHPQVSEEDAGEMVRWILSLGSAPKPKQGIALSGTYALTVPGSPDSKSKPKPGTFLLKASYRDRGSASQGPQENSETIALRPTFQQAEQADSISRGVRTYRPFNGDTVVLNDLKNNGFFVFKHTDVTGIHTIAMGVGMSDNKYQFGGGRVEIRLDSPKGTLIGKAAIPADNGHDRMPFTEIAAPLTDPGDGQFHDLYFVLKNENNPSKPVAAVDWVRFDLR